jgi:hypothetical protein
VRGERLDLRRADGRREQCVVADLQVAVEREVIGGEAHVGVEEGLQPALGRQIERPWRSRPEEAVVDDDQVGSRLARAREEVEIRADARRDGLDLGPPRDLETVRSVVLEGGGVQEFVEKADEVVTGCQRTLRGCPAFL